MPCGALNPLHTQLQQQHDAVAAAGCNAGHCFAPHTVGTSSSCCRQQDKAAVDKATLAYSLVGPSS